jgi:predicted transcriptional regulator
MSMIRTTVYLSAESKRRLRSAARRRNRSEATLIRDAIDRLLADEPSLPRPNPPVLNIDAGLADHADDYLSRGFGADGLEDTEWHG